MKEYNCRICGLEHSSPIWGDDNVTPSYEICHCCGGEFGNDDYTIESIVRYRNRWVTSGLIWFYPKDKPRNWNFSEQILNVLKQYRELR
ncbi:MAG: hypothetical protein KTR22_06620 [Flavobacteriaceae bacterium]|nr:hypothetical protein [Flavobacteriaceae bacterium]